jgi:hypothetical protein
VATHCNGPDVPAHVDEVVSPIMLLSGMAHRAKTARSCHKMARQVIILWPSVQWSGTRSVQAAAGAALHYLLTSEQATDDIACLYAESTELGDTLLLNGPLGCGKSSFRCIIALDGVTPLMRKACNLACLRVSAKLVASVQ